ASGLATDGDHLYWITRSGTTSTIHRVELNSGTPEVVTTFDNEGNFPRGVEVDETYLYWAEGQIGAGAVRRMPKDGGPIVKLAGPGDGLDNTAALEIDESHVYFAGIADNRVRRVPKAGGAIFDYVSNWNSEVEIDGMPADDARSVGSLLVHEDRLIWTDTTGGYDGRVRRIETSSSAVEDNEVTDLQILALAPRAAHVSGGSVYWAQNEQVYRTPIDSTGIAIDLSLTHMEVTQALQNVPANGEAGDVPLVEDKVTWIRLYPWIEAPDAPPGAYIHQNHVSARVRGYRDGVELPGSPLVPTSPELAVKPHAERRKHLDRTFNFFVPPSWRSGVVELEAEINPGGAIAETDYSNNVILGEITFETPRPLCLVFVPVKTPDGTPSVTDTTMDDIFANLKILWPTGRIHRGTVDSIS
ncbi:MAG TPA: hypothetical protein VK116_20390, partial [Planctomycetota bacterium]|nr:hypothetical protein [Planctomycetota bacterium]